MAKSYWLVKQEPTKYPFEQFVKDKKTTWDGVRNYQARNNLQAMKKGDRVLYYHSNVGQEVVGLCEALNPERVPGRLTLISRMGAERVGEALPPLLEAVKASGHPVVWACDPMHGNTFTAPNGRKTRHLDAVLTEIVTKVERGELQADPRHITELRLN